MIRAVKEGRVKAGCALVDGGRWWMTALQLC